MAIFISNRVRGIWRLEHFDCRRLIAADMVLIDTDLRGNKSGSTSYLPPHRWLPLKVKNSSWSKLFPLKMKKRLLLEYLR